MQFIGAWGGDFVEVAVKQDKGAVGAVEEEVEDGAVVGFQLPDGGVVVAWYAALRISAAWVSACVWIFALGSRCSDCQWEGAVAAVFLTL